ncbi:kynureninase [Flexivirga oryzae]|uniref:Kynureninase n=1 Tax=Flexivirga oryzae TaxID=1794944 RepID=A0A839NHK0_9MICO|nr:aminotransferase class V-fold PLP-dependent enzyme [Flexivirga oryzae]MBB2893902.1 kynureninase [Flexivirga oryzae]
MTGDILSRLPDHLVAEAKALDEGDPLAAYREEFVHTDAVVAYLDGNSLGRPLATTRGRLGDFVAEDWGERLIRAWDEQWMELPLHLGDRIGRVTLGAAPGQTVVADSTTVLLYKLARAALAARPGRTRIVADTENFPTDRYIVQGIAAELGLTIRWIEPDPATGVTAEEVRAAVADDTALVLLSHVAYKSAHIADLPAITRVAHDAGALVLWDLCHSVGLLPIGLDAAGVDLAVGCTYKYLNGGPGAPAFGYVATALQDNVVQPIQGWMGHAEPFTMGPSYTPSGGMRRFISGTPPVLGMLPMQDMLALIERAGVDAIREKSVRLTEFVIDLADEALAPLGVTVASPRDPLTRGGHVTLEHDGMQDAIAQLWQRGVIPDFRRPRGLRAGMSPLSTSFVEVATAMAHLHQILSGQD